MREGIKLVPDDEPTRRALNDLARHQAIRRLLTDMLIDAQICRVEGWDPREFGEMVAAAIGGDDAR